MKVVAPVSAIDEVDLLADEGADELYCGVVPTEWIERYSHAVWLNRRSVGRANLSSLDQLRALIRRAHDRGLPVAVTMNAPYYTADQLPAVRRMAEELGEAGADAIIVSDLGLVRDVAERELGLQVHVSSVAAVRNSETARMFAELGVHRIILPRHVSVREVARIVQQAPGPEYEVFALNDGCIYEEGFCSTTHGVGSFCTTPWEYTFYRQDGRPVSADSLRELQANLDDYRDWINHMNNCGGAWSQTGLPYGPCGLCAFFELRDAGVAALKVVGRESTVARKVRSVQMVRAVVDRMSSPCSRDEARAFAIRVRGDREICESGYLCYYRAANPLGAP